MERNIEAQKPPLVQGEYAKNGICNFHIATHIYLEPILMQAYLKTIAVTLTENPSHGATPLTKVRGGIIVTYLYV